MASQPNCNVNVLHPKSDGLQPIRSDGLQPNVGAGFKDPRCGFGRRFIFKKSLPSFLAQRAVHLRKVESGGRWICELKMSLGGVGASQLSGGGVGGVFWGVIPDLLQCQKNLPKSLGLLPMEMRDCRPQPPQWMSAKPSCQVNPSGVIHKQCLNPSG